MEYSKTQLYNKVKPYFLVIIMQFGYAGMSIIGKYALNKGMSQHVFIAYQHAIAAVVIAPFAIVLDRSPSPPFLLLYKFFNSFLQCYMLNEMKRLTTLIWYF